ncbi:YdcF family protein [Caldimonas brevitalea]|uniref:Membrane protein n=1 Tax=Caldimonas brevitalea TaxID=413882 RepID=A0A0G3BNM1_9BURK|nr:YdcF family protein [Caldimonas brevitalea]AKJ28145.1 membrane protein [Caldimonas brevitalea]
MFDTLASYKPLLTALALPPASLIVLLLLGARLMVRRRVLGFSVVLTCCVLLWLTSTQAFARLLQVHVLRLPSALSATEIERLQTELKPPAKVGSKAVATPPRLAIIVLGAGMKPLAPEYGVSDLTPTAMERLRYGVWLSRATGAPLGFSGGLGWAQADEQPAEAVIAQRIVQQEYGRHLTWVEDRSRDTRENALRTAPLLQEAGVRRVLLVTHGWHMRRAARAFREALGSGVEVVPAPVGLFQRRPLRGLDWLPSTDGLLQNRLVLRELLGLTMGS